MPKWHKEEKQCSGELNDEEKSEVKVNEDDGNDPDTCKLNKLWCNISCSVSWKNLSHHLFSCKLLEVVY